MTEIVNNNKRIAKNTLLLYFRMLLMMVVTLYTSREVLDKLGVVDYGIYNVVGGIVGMLGFINASMTNAVQRFLSFEIGKGNKEQVNRVFNVSLMVHFCIAIIVFVIIEIVGVWYLNTYMNIPTDRLNAANWVLQCSILTTIFSIIQVPYNAIIISKEQMGIFAYISILEVTLKLAIVYLLNIGHFDKLKLYSVLVMLVTIFILCLYRIYCTKKYSEAKFKIIKDIKTFKEIVSFAGWNMLEELAWVFSGQGVNILINFFWGPAANAARGLAIQVNNAVSHFVSNFQVAVNPQLIKTYAMGELDEMKKLLFRTIRFSFYIMFILSMPLIINMKYILQIWLKDVPEYSTTFCQLALINSLVGTITNPFSQVARAYGKIRKYQIWVSIILFANFPLSYLALKVGALPYVTMGISILVQILLIFARFYLTKHMICLSTNDFFNSVIYPVGKVVIFSIFVPCLCFVKLSKSWQSSLIITIITLVFTFLFVLSFGVSKEERNYIMSIVKKLRKNNKI